MKPLKEKTMKELVDDLDKLLKPSPVFNLNKIVSGFQAITKMSMKVTRGNHGSRK